LLFGSIFFLSFIFISSFVSLLHILTLLLTFYNSVFFFFLVFFFFSSSSTLLTGSMVYGPRENVNPRGPQVDYQYNSKILAIPDT
jgi:hypothetical protein